MLPTTVPAELELPALSPSSVTVSSSLLVPGSTGSADGEAGGTGEAEAGGGDGVGAGSAGDMFPSGGGAVRAVFGIYRLSELDLAGRT